MTRQPQDARLGTGLRRWFGWVTQAGRIGQAATVAVALWSFGGGIAQAAETMTFRLATIGTENNCRRGCAEIISAEGEITNDTADQFLAFLTEHGQDPELRPVVLIQSPGGTVVGAMQLGTAFRKLGAAVIVAAVREYADTHTSVVTSGSCMSACAYAFFGGKRRVLPPLSRLGIHRMVIDEAVADPDGGTSVQRIYGSQDFVAVLSQYTKSMGVDPAVIGYAERVSPDAIHIVTPAEVARWRLGSRRL